MISVLEFDSIDLSFGDKKILSNIYMRCQTGEVVGLLGRNGSGKSTLLKVVFGSLQATYKSVRIDGESLTGNYLNKQLIAYLPQEKLVPNLLTVRKAFELFKIKPEVFKEDFPEIMQFLDVNPSQISGGYRRLIDILLVLNSPARFCLLDEPFSGLMPVLVERIVILLTKAKTKKGIILTDHLYKHVTSVSDRLYILTNGQSRLIKEKEDLVLFGYVNRW